MTSWLEELIKRLKSWASDATFTLRNMNEEMYYENRFTL